MYVVTVEFSVKPGHEAEFLDRVRRQARDSLERERECHVFDVCIDPERADFVFLYEVYNDRQAFDLHLQSDHFLDFDRCVAGWIADKRVSTMTRLQPA